MEIPFSRPAFDDHEAKAVAEVLASGWVSQGPRVAAFERAFAARVHAAHGVATSSCTTALHLALLLTGAGPDDEVICPSYSFIATANAVLYARAAPVFADIDADTWNLSARDVACRLTPRTRAILLVHQVGLAADLDAFAEFERRGITIIEDAACAVGSTYGGRPIGAHGHLTCFSFHPRKTISTGEGGMLTTDDDQIAERARRLRSFGASISDRARHEAKGLIYEEYGELGYNYRLTDLQAAVGLEQLKKLDRYLADRRCLAERYDEAFARLPGVQRPVSPASAPHAYQSYGIRLLGATAPRRDDILRELVSRGISCRRGIPPIHREPLYRERFGRVDLPVTDEVADTTIFLPIFSGLREADQAGIIEAVIELVGKS